MSRQIGIVLGVSGLVAVLGVPHGFAGVHAAFRDSWWVIAAVSLAAVWIARARPHVLALAATRPAAPAR